MDIWGGCVGWECGSCFDYFLALLSISFGHFSFLDEGVVGNGGSDSTILFPPI